MLTSMDALPAFPNPESARPDGLVAIGGDFSPERLRLAYRSGIFPWSVNPITWWSPDPRGVLELGQLHISRSLDRSLRRGGFRVTSDLAFSEVITACAEVPRPGQSSWISRPFVVAYQRLYELGFAHSIEVWKAEELVGGLYGVVTGGCFSGESMFHRVSDASKVGLVHLVRHLQTRGFVLFDTQMVTPVTESLGAKEIPRADFLRRLRQASQLTVTFGQIHASPPVCSVASPPRCL